ncbi:MAG: hypothetical protein HY235_07045 [Acidobacteria bacterium]|nr:hypothetical protein [Acidobacteriota bacterium]
MPKLVAAGTPVGYDGGAVDFFGLGVNNWAFRGIAITTAEQVAATQHTYFSVMVASTVPTTNSRKLSDYETDITFDRILLYPYEEEAHGPMEAATNEAAFFRSIGIAFILNGRNITIQDSMIKGVGGYNPGTPAVATANSATAASPAVITSPGIAAAFELTAGVSACSTGCTSDCWTNFGCRVAVFSGAAGNWANLNGAKHVVYETADSVRVYLGDSYALSDPKPYDATGKGALSGTVTLRRGIPIEPFYAILLPTASRNVQIINNFLEAWSMTIFTGGGGYEPTDNTATVQSGSTATSIVLSNVANLNVDDLISVPAPGRSIYCPSSVKGCWAGGVRAGKVTAINPAANTITVIPWGVDGIDVAPTVGGLARWNGDQTSWFQLRRNTIFRSDGHTLNGKGYIELKNCLHCLIDGNILTDSAAGNWFLTARTQGGNDPWNRGENLRFSNNIAGGNNGAPARLILQGEDDEHTSQKSRNVFFENNLMPDMRFPNSATANPFNTLSAFDTGTGIINGGWVHNTTFPRAGSSSHRVYSPTACIDSPAPYLYSSDVVLRDNISGYGEGIATTPCWTNQSSGIKSNVFIATGSAGTSQIQSSWPGNFAVPDTSALFAGTCNFANWENCALDAASPYKGAASDGKDVGADVAQIKDRVNGWSEEAGLLTFDPARGALLHTGSWQVGSTNVAVTFRLFGPLTGCTMELFTNGGRTSLHPDTASAGEQSCGRSGNLLQDGLVTFVLGSGVALNPSTKHYYRLKDGNRVMVGDFQTVPSTGNPPQGLVQVSDPTAADLVVEYSNASSFAGASETAPAAFVSQRAVASFSVPGQSVIYYRWKKRRADNSVLALSSTRVAVAR